MLSTSLLMLLVTAQLDQSEDPRIANLVFKTTGPVIEDDSGVLAHVTWNGTALVDSVSGNSWTQNGTVPQVTTSPLYPSGFSGSARAGAGPYTAANYYQLGTGSDVLDVTTFSFCIVYNTNVDTSGGVLASDGQSNTSGWYLQQNGSGQIVFRMCKSGSCGAATGTLITIGGIGVVCAGYDTSTVYVKNNLEAIVTTAFSGGVSNTTQALILGQYSVSSLPFNGTLYEFYATTTTPSDSLFTKIQNRVFSHLTTSGQVVTFTRSSTASYISGGKLYYAPQSVMRIDSSGYLLENQVTNNMLQSEAFGNASWTNTGTCSVGPVTAADSATDPSGTSTADTLTQCPAGDGSVSHGRYQSFTYTANPYTLSVFAKAATGTQCFDLAFKDDAVTHAKFNPTTGVVVATGTGVTATATSIGSGWYLFSATATLTAVAQFPELYLDGDCTTTFNKTFTGDGSSSIYIWGAMLEQNRNGTSYIPTTTATVTRSPDLSSIPNPFTSGGNDLYLCGTTAATTLGPWTPATGQFYLFNLGAVASNNSINTQLSNEPKLYIDSWDTSGTRKLFYFVPVLASGSTHTITTCADGAGNASVWIDRVSQSLTISGTGNGYITTQPATLFLGSGSATTILPSHVTSWTFCRTSDPAKCQP